MNTQTPEQLINMLNSAGQLVQMTAPAFLNTAKTAISVSWNSSLKTIDKIMTEVTDANSVEEMGRKMCEQMLLAPLTFLNETLNQLDAMILAWAKNNGKGGNGGGHPGGGRGGAGGPGDGHGGETPPGPTPTPGPTPPGPVPGPTPPGPVPGPTPTDEDDQFRRDIAAIIRMNQISRFHSQYLNALAAANTPDKRKLFEDLRPVFDDDHMTHEKLAADHPDLSNRFWADLPHTLADPANRNLKNLFMSMDVFPEELRNAVAQQIEAINAARTGAHEGNEPKPTEPPTPPKLPADVRALTEKLDNSATKEDIVAALQEDLNKRSAEASLDATAHDAWRDALARVNKAARSLSKPGAKPTSSHWDEDHKHWSHVAETNNEKGPAYQS